LGEYSKGKATRSVRLRYVNWCSKERQHPAPPSTPPPPTPPPPPPPPTSTSPPPKPWSWPPRVQALHIGEGLSLSSTAPNTRRQLANTRVRMTTFTTGAPTSVVNSSLRQHVNCICAIIKHIYLTVLVVLGTFKWSGRLMIMLFKECSRLVGVEYCCT